MRPIVNWKFNLQIIFVIINIFILVSQAVLYFLSKWMEVKFPLSPFFLSYSSVLAGLIVLGFQAILFRTYPIIRNLLIITILFRVFFVMVETFKVIFIAYLYKNTAWTAFHLFLDLAVLIIAMILYGIILTPKYNAVPLVKMFRPFAITAMIGRVFIFMFSILMGIESIYFLMSPIRFITYPLLAIPYIFLIAYYIKLKRVYPTLTNNVPVEPDQSWPPKQD
jgi:hypothetical protein